MKKIIWTIAIFLMAGIYASAQTTESTVNDPTVTENVAPQQHSCSGHQTQTANTPTSTEDATVTETSTTQKKKGNTEMKSCNGSESMSCCQGKTDKSCCQHMSKTEMLKTSTQESPNSGQQVSTDTTTPQE